MKPNRPLVIFGYIIAACIVLIPIYDTLSGALPPQLGVARWRFSVVGLLAQTFLSPLMGGALAVSLAIGFEHPRTLRFVGFVAGMATLAIVLIIPLFLFDSLAMRDQANPQAATAVDLAIATALVKMSIAGVALAALTMGALRAGREGRKGQKSQAGLVVGSAGRAGPAAGKD